LSRTQASRRVAMRPCCIAVFAMAALVGVGLLDSTLWAFTAPSATREVASRRLLSTARRAKVDGAFGVLQETPGPLIDTRINDNEEDPLLACLVAAVQAADRKRGIDISAFWVRNRWEVVVIVTALSRPQLQAIANEIADDMRHKMRTKRILSRGGRASARNPGFSVRDEAAAGWVCLRYERITINVMTPVQRTYYDIEGIWRDDNQDYTKIPVEVMLRGDGFGDMRLTKELGGSGESKRAGQEEDDDDDWGDDEEDIGQPAPFEKNPDNEYDIDEDDPFWK